MDISGSNRTESGLIRDLRLVKEAGQSRPKAQADYRDEMGSDKAIISNQGQLLQRLSEAVRESPDVRSEKVAMLREAIQSGQYEVSAEEIAKAILASRKT
ncbi:MAG: flagellar biosynthesis anti-sigma factor FlgM [Chloroflexota bacterium]|jgi:negative regulator of flagellin synthesis FlgM